MSARPQFQIVNGLSIGNNKTEVIAISPNGTDWDYIMKQNILMLGFVYFDNTTITPRNYPYPTKTLLKITMVGDLDVIWELQDISNQPGWSTGTQAGINQALS